jgi:hypothetical protein
MKSLVEKSEEKRKGGRPRVRCEYNTKMDLKETDYQGVTRIYLARGRIQLWAPLKMAKKFRIPKEGKEFLDRLSD